MKRHALLVGSTRGNNPLPMVTRDLNVMMDHLKSIKGGAWEISEISMLCDTDVSTVNKKLIEISIQKNDFLFFYWSGHGGHNKDMNQLALEVSPKSDMYEADFEKLAPRQLMIFDTCRTFFSENVASMESLRESKLFSTVDTNLRMIARQIYEVAVMSSPEGVQSFYSSELGKPSNATSRHSKFTKCILDVAEQWYVATKSNIMAHASMLFVVDAATPCCQTRGGGGSQTPDYAVPKSSNLFPFIVKP